MDLIFSSIKIRLILGYYRIQAGPIQVGLGWGGCDWSAQDKNGVTRMSGEPLVILLAEDNTDHAELILRCLRDHNVAIHVAHVSDGEAALDYLFRRGEYANPDDSPRPHVILLDLRMPKLDGMEVLRQVKESEETRRIPVIILTTSEAEHDVNGAYERYANSYLVKPIGFESFSRMLAELGFYWLAINRSPGG